MSGLLKIDNNTLITYILSIIIFFELLFLIFLILQFGNEVKFRDHLLLGNKYYNEMDYENAEIQYLAAIKIDKKEVIPYINLSQVYIDTENFEEAMDILETAKKYVKKKDHNQIIEQEKKFDEIKKTKKSDTDVISEITVTDAYVDTVTSWSRCCYHIPQVIINGNTDFEINTIIYNDLYSIIESVKESERLYGDDSSWFPGTVSMLYTWGRKNDVISITVQTYGKYHEWQEYKTYYFSLSTYEMLTQNDILELYDLSENDFYTLAKNTMQRYWEYRTQILSSSELNESYILLEETLEDENVKSAEAIIDIDGNLCISAHISDPTNGYPYAQPYIISTTNPEQNFDWLSCDMDHFN